MATKASDFTNASTLDGTEYVPVIQGGANKKTTVQDIVDRIGSASSFTLTADGSYSLAAGSIITAIVVDCAADFTLDIGSTDGGNEFGADLAIPGGDWYGLTILIPAKTTRTIYFSGIVASTRFILIKNVA